ncbi:formate dehydrogenase accessory sulfurtransferase FdhD [Armatimonas rosea]|uniref:Sulfur carrier protein FdhD n=1 Tax=Armatimonas rosea TaxID=685828 RepID=A0A7W9SMH2_ARMRO|nr:formate dehydrogenase accessory sulfurtransferase FdhD [Armatimonas rosea]MBB6049357.1 FdhD protein [Armatimonas rosea]
MRTSTTTLLRSEAGKRTPYEDCLAVEEPLTIRVNGEILSVTMRTPGEDEELTLGFLYGEGILPRPTDYLQLQGGDITLAPGIPLPPPLRRFPTHAACGVCGRTSLPHATEPPARKGGPLFPEALFRTLDPQVRAAQAIFETTGGLHAAALFAQDGTLLCLREDIGRHNAVDKVIGWALQNGHVPLTSHLLFLSGRVSYELVQKAARAGIPALVAVGAPSSLAVAMCQEADITLVGFLRGERYNIYSGEWRIVF